MRAFPKPKRIFYSKQVKKIKSVKRGSKFNKAVFFINVLVALLLMAACAVPHISDERFSFLAFLSLAVPVLVAINFLFLLFWLLQRRKQLWLSLLVLTFGYFVLGSFVKLGFSEKEILDKDLSIMSYNVRVFNKYGVIDHPNIFENIKALVDQERPDVICFQEPDYQKTKDFTNEYPYQFIKYQEGKGRLGIFSKYEILKAELINFPKSHNNGAYADILYKNDTIRIYNVHLQSLGITPGRGIITNEPKEKLFKMLTKNFKIQQQQAKIVAAHMQTTNYKHILCGDFNNSQFSNTYHTIKGDMQDTFIEKGIGYGRTLNFHGLPLRIDFIMADKTFKVKSHKNYDEEYSDHFPIMASFEMNAH